MNRQAWRDFFITAFFLGLAFIIALLSSIAAEQSASMHAAIAAAISLLLALLGALYIIPKLARNVRLEILRFAVRTTVTVEGLLFVIFLAIIAFAAWNTGNNLLYLVLSAMLAFLIAANLIARLSLAEVAVQLRFPDHVFAEEPANLLVTIINHKRLMPSYSLMIEALSDAGEEEEEAEAEEPDSEAQRGADMQTRKSGAAARPRVLAQRRGPPGGRAQAQIKGGLGKLAYFVLAPNRSSVRQRIEYTFGRRGRYPITGFRISTKFPAGFFKKWRRIDAAGEILVYPKPQPLDDFYHALPMLAGQIESHVRGSGDDLYAIRRYHPSDQMRHVDWKATAKSLEMMVRENTREDEWRLTIVFDTSRPRDEAALKQAGADPKPDAATIFEERFERAVVMAASLANHFILERADVELIAPDREHNVDAGSGHEHLYKILRSLATLHPTPLPGEDDLSEQKRGKRRLYFFGRSRRRKADAQAADVKQQSIGSSSPATEWRLLDQVPVLADERRFKVLITSAAKGSIPANVWRSAHVVFMEDL